MIYEGYASVFDVIDNQNDLVCVGAFDNTLNSERKVPLLNNHNPYHEVGLIHALYCDGVGLFCVFSVPLIGTLGAGLSIGYSPVRYSVCEVTKVRRLYEVELWEISLCEFPANSACSVKLIKSSII